MRMLGQVALAGFSTVVLWKLLGIVFFPMFGLLLGVLSVLFKVAMMTMIGYVILSLFKRCCQAPDND